MTNEPGIQHVADVLENLQRHWEEKRKSQAVRWLPEFGRKQGFTIAVARATGVDDDAVARELGGRLHWPVYDRELLKRIAQDSGLRESLIESVDEKRVSWLEETFETVMGEPYVSETAYVHHLVKTLLALAASGECVIVGRGAAQILPPRTTLRTRIGAPITDRIDFLRHKLSITPTEAARLIRKRDREHRAFIRSHFYKDPWDPENYDLVLNFSRLGVAGCADVALRALSCLQPAVLSHSVQ
jgi:cytidylate kinase